MLVKLDIADDGVTFGMGAAWSQQLAPRPRAESYGEATGASPVRPGWDARLSTNKLAFFADGVCVTIDYSMKRADVSLFPILLKLKAKKCVVVGAGKIAAAKAGGLLTSGARVVVIGPRADGWIQSQARAGKVIWRRRRFTAADLEQAFLVIAATNSTATNEAVYQACVERGVLCNVVDVPERCDFFYPAVVRRGPLQIAISTDGRSPALARRLRIELERQFGAEYGAWVEQVGEMRQKLRRRNLPAAERRKLLDQIASHDSFERFVQQRGPAKARRSKKKAGGSAGQ